MKSITTLLLLLLVFSNSLNADNHRSPSSEGASVDFANISDGDRLPNSFVVNVTISGMGIAPAGVDIENTGHHHLLIDVQELPDFNQPLPANDNFQHFGEGQTETELWLADGEHSLQLMLADHTHTPHEPPVMSKVIRIVISADAPAQTENLED